MQRIVDLNGDYEDLIVSDDHQGEFAQEESIRIATSDSDWDALFLPRTKLPDLIRVLSEFLPAESEHTA